MGWGAAERMEKGEQEKQNPVEEVSWVTPNPVPTRPPKEAPSNCTQGSLFGGVTLGYARAHPSASVSPFVNEGPPGPRWSSRAKILSVHGGCYQVGP